MSALVCLQSRGLLDRRASGLSDAERLRVEEHLSTCAECSAHSEMLSQLVSLAREQQDQLSDMARQRAITSALAHGTRTQEQPSVVGGLMWPRLTLIGGALLTTVAVMILWMKAPTSPQAPGGASAEIDATPSTPVVQSYRADQARRVTIEGAALQLEAGTDVTWDARLARVSLLKGRVRAVVASRAGKTPFSVRTPKLTVVVIGTDFEVSVDTVHVHEGVVRVEDNMGGVLHAGLRAGEQWPLSPVVEEAPEVSAPAAVQHAEASSRGHERSPIQWLADAHSRLSAGDVSGARQAIAQLRRARVEPSQRAEAETLLAEAFQVEGKTARALAQYDAVARDYPGLAAGDNAMFAAARLASMSGNQHAATQRLQSYLRAYPRGRFHAEAARSLATLAKREADRVGGSSR